MAAPPASATPARCPRHLRGHRRGRSGRPLGPVGQPQLRRPVSPDVRANYLASPPLVVAYALAGTMNINLPPIRSADAGRQGRLPQGHLADQAEIAELVEQTVTREAFIEKYADVFKGDEKWQGVEVTSRRRPTTGPRLDLCPEPALFRGHGRSRARSRTSRTPGAGDPGRHDHHRPHLPGRVVQGTTPGRQVPVERQVRCGSSTPTARAAATTRS
jgi:aconitate hydratase